MSYGRIAAGSAPGERWAMVLAFVLVGAAWVTVAGRPGEMPDIFAPGPVAERALRTHTAGSCSPEQILSAIRGPGQADLGRQVQDVLQTCWRQVRSR